MGQSFKIKFWGVRGSTPCPNRENMVFGGNTTCLELSIDGSDEMLILDCGTGVRNLGNHLNSNGNSVKGRIFITHPHWDHLQGFPFFKPFYNERNWFRVYIPPQGDIGCKEILQGHMSSTFFPVSYDMLEADLGCETMLPEQIQFEHYSVEYLWANHTVPTAIFKFRIGDKTVIFAPDNELAMDDSEETREFITNFRKFIHDADVLIHDAQFNNKQYQERIGWGHTSWERLVPIAKEENVKRLLLTHHDPDHNDDYLSELDRKIQDEHSDSFEYISIVKEGQELSLPAHQ